MTEAIKVQNLAQVQRALKQLGVSASEISQAGFEAATIVANQSKQEVPVRSGALSKSIKAAKVQRGAVVRAGSAVRVPYANPIHWGWFRRHIKPNPFFYRALDSRIDEVRAKYDEQMKKLIEKVSVNAKH